MKTVSLTQVAIGSRQRKHIAAAGITELADSIATYGLIHPIVCVETADGLQLVAGERRYRAVKQLSDSNRIFSCDGVPIIPGHIPYIRISDLDDIQLREAELEENIRRLDLTWREKVTATDELHQLRLARNPKQTESKTADEISKKGSHTSNDRRLVAWSRTVAPHLDDPEVAHASDLTEAFKIVSRKIESELNLMLTERAVEKTSRHTLLLGDFTSSSLIASLPSDFTCIIADPPYGIGANTFGNAAQLSHTYDDSKLEALAFAQQLFQVGLDITAAQAHLYLFCDIEHFLELRAMGKEFGWKVWRTPLIWHKTSAAAHAPSQNYGFRRSYELILFASKGNKPFAQVYSDVFDYSAPQIKDVAAQKPTALYEVFLDRSCLPGDRVLDPCCGSGTIFRAAENRRLEAWGVEKDVSSHAIAQLTLSSL